MLNCIPLRFLREATVIDDKTIFFVGAGKKGYMNRLPNNCPRLVEEDRFTYTTSIGQFCTGDLITVIDSLGREWGACALSEFEEYQKKPRTNAPEQNSE